MPTADVTIVVVVVAAALSHSYAPYICTLHDCDGPALSLIQMGTLAVMAAAAGLLLYRAFKYREIEYASLRSMATFWVMLIACSHTAVYNLCHASVMECGAFPTALTLLLLIMAGGMLGVNPRVVWLTRIKDTGDTKAADRLYFNTVIDGRYFVWIYWATMTLVMWLVWILGIAVWLFEPEVLVPLLTGLFGPFIALWFANRERNRSITENYFYKTQVLMHMSKMLDCVVLWSMNSNAGGTGWLESGGAADGEFMPRYRYHRGHMERLSTNTYVPTDVRYSILNFMHSLDDALTPHSPPLASNNTAAVIKHALQLFDVINNLEYFTADRDPHVRDLWAKTKQRLGIVRNGIVNVTDPAS